MAITVLKQPQELSLSKNPIVLHLKTDNIVIGNNVNAVTKWTIGKNSSSNVLRINDNDWFKLYFGPEPIVFKARQNPNPSYFEFKSGAFNQDIGQSIVSAINSYALLLEQYTVESQYDVQSNTTTITFTQKVASANNNLAVQYYFYAYRTSIFGSSTSSEQSVAPLIRGQSAYRRADFEFYIDLFIESEPDKFERIFSGKYDPDNNNEREIQLQKRLQAHLQYDFPEHIENTIVKCQKSIKRYYVRYSEFYDNRVNQSWETPKYYVTLGGFDFVSLVENESITAYLQPDENKANIRFLEYDLNQVITRVDQPEFVSYINLTDAYQIVLHADVRFSDGSSQTYAALSYTGVKKFDKFVIPAGFSQLDLAAANPDKSPVYYELYLTSAGQQISVKRLYQLKTIPEIATRYFLYGTSLGSIKTFRAGGKGSRELEFFKDSAIKELQPGYGISDNQSFDYNNKFKRSEEVASGNLQNYQVEQLADFFISSEKYIVIGNRQLAINVQTKSFKKAKDRENLNTIKFEYEFAHENELYTDPYLSVNDQPAYPVSLNPQPLILPKNDQPATGYNYWRLLVGMESIAIEAQKTLAVDTDNKYIRAKIEDGRLKLSLDVQELSMLYAAADTNWDDRYAQITDVYDKETINDLLSKLGPWLLYVDGAEGFEEMGFNSELHLKGSSGLTIVRVGNTVSFSLDPDVGTIKSVFGRKGDIVAKNGDYNTDLVPEGAINKYCTNQRVQNFTDGRYVSLYDSQEVYGQKFFIDGGFFGLTENGVSIVNGNINGNSQYGSYGIYAPTEALPARFLFGSSVLQPISKNLTGNRNWYLPDASGTIALKSDIPAIDSYVQNTPSRAITDWNILPSEGLMHGLHSSINGPVQDGTMNSYFTAFNLRTDTNPQYNNLLGVAIDGTIYARNQQLSWGIWRKIWDSGNSNLPTTPWGASTYYAFASEAFQINSKVGYISWIDESTANRNGFIQNDNGTFYIQGDQGNKYVCLNATGGNVGIGTTTPQAKLDVNGDVYANSKVFVFASGTTLNPNYQGTSIHFDTSNNLYGSLISSTGSNAAFLNYNIAGNNGSAFKNYASFGDTTSYITSGNFGIGTSTPNSKLDVAGLGMFNGELALFRRNTVNGNVDGQFISTLWFESGEAGTLIGSKGNNSAFKTYNIYGYDGNIIHIYASFADGQSTINGSLTVSDRTGTASTLMGATAGGKLVEVPFTNFFKNHVYGDGSLTDWNNPPEEGIFHGSMSTLNSPTGYDFTAFNIRLFNRTDCNNQFGIDGIAGFWWTRSQLQGTWGPWRQIFDSGNSNLPSVRWQAADAVDPSECVTKRQLDAKMDGYLFKTNSYNQVNYYPDVNGAKQTVFITNVGARFKAGGSCELELSIAPQVDYSFFPSQYFSATATFYLKINNSKIVNGLRQRLVVGKLDLLAQPFQYKMRASLFSAVQSYGANYPGSWVQLSASATSISSETVKNISSKFDLSREDGTVMPPEEANFTLEVDLEVTPIGALTHDLCRINTKSTTVAFIV